MGDIPTQRPFQQRFLDGFERSRLRNEVQRSKRNRLSSLKRRYGTMVLGASLAVGGLGIPLKSLSLQSGSHASSNRGSESTSSAVNSLSQDLKAAGTIAEQVTSGVTAAAETLTAPLHPSSAATDVRSAKESMRAEFFAREVPFGKIIYSEAKKNDLPPELVAAVVQQESRFVPTARSHMGAQGLMQLVPKTGKWMGATNLMNPAENVRAGAKYLKYLNQRFDGDSRKVIAAYNAGEGNVKRFGGVPPFAETQKYVRNVMSFKQDFADRLDGHVADTLEQQLPSAASTPIADLR